MVRQAGLAGLVGSAVRCEYRRVGADGLRVAIYVEPELRRVERLPLVGLQLCAVQMSAGQAYTSHWRRE